jgi:hypothetical protein
MPSKKTNAKSGRSKKSKVRRHVFGCHYRIFDLSSKVSKQLAPETEEEQDDSLSQLLGITIAAINTTKDLVPIDLAKGILGTIANILIIAQVR